MPSLSPDHRQRIQQILAASPLIPVITIDHPDQALPLCQALVDGGIRVLEITLRTPHGLEAIHTVRSSLPDNIWVGAGTVVTRDQYREAEHAGAQFVISPGSIDPLLDFAVTSEVPLMPGISTVSELMVGYNLGYREFKFFPAEVAGGTPALRAFAGPFPDVVFCPTGGIRPETAPDYLALQNVASVGGSWLTPRALVDASDWEGIRRLARDSLELLGRGS